MSWRVARGVVYGALAAVALAPGGCILHKSNPAATQPATVTDPRTMEPDHWWSQQGVAGVTATDFQRLWDACHDTARDHLFTIDRVDYRNGVMTTRPLTSKQFFEVWRPDVRTAGGVVQSSLATERRTIRFEFAKQPDSAAYTAVPKVLVERYAIAGRRISNVLQYQQITTATQDPARIGPGGKPIPIAYWYPISGDHALEAALAEAVRRRVK